MSSSDTHTVRVLLRVSPKEIEHLELQAWCLGQLYNATLDTMIGRVNQLRRSKKWKALREQVTKTPEDKKREKEEYQQLKKSFGVSDYDCIKVAQAHCRNSNWLADHLDGRMCTALGKEVWTNVSLWMFGDKGRPGFKNSHSRTSLTGNDLQAGLKYIAGKNGQPGRVCQQTRAMQRSKSKLASKRLNARTDWSNMSKERSAYYLAHQDTVKRARIVLVRDADSEKIKRVEAHIIFSCKPYRSKAYLESRPSAGLISMDFGPASAAWVTSDNAKGIIVPDATIKKKLKAIRSKRKQIEQAMDRSRRDMNPECYDEKRNPIKGKRHKVESKAQKKRRLKRKQLYAEDTKIVNEFHQKTIRKVTGLGNRLITEKDLFGSWQRRGYGKSIQTYSFGGMKDSLLREFQILGGSTFEHNPYITSLSQYCLCGQKNRKEISQRSHGCQNPECNLFEISLHRDLFSAFLGLLVQQNGIKKLSQGQLTEHWTTAVELCSAGSVAANTAGLAIGGKISCLEASGDADASRLQEVSHVNMSMLGRSFADGEGRSREIYKEDSPAVFQQNMSCIDSPHKE